MATSTVTVTIDVVCPDTVTYQIWQQMMQSAVNGTPHGQFKWTIQAPSKDHGQIQWSGQL